jgi:cell division protein WhiA
VSLSEDVRRELAAIAPSRECCRLAELSALCHTAGSFHLRGRGEISVHLDLADSAVARRAFALLRGFDVPSEIRTYQRRAFGRETRYQLHVAGSRLALAVLREAGVLDRRLGPLETPPRRIVGRSCCRGAYLRGALLGSGSLSRPPAAHLEIRATGSDGASLLARIADAEGVTLKVLDRGRHAIAYAKGLETIAGALALAGASDTALALEERAVVGTTRARANRLANADHANLVRASRAASRQLRAIAALEHDGLFDLLSPSLRDAADLRTRHPSLALGDLGRKARPPLTKAAMARRLARLVRLSEADHSRG